MLGRVARVLEKKTHHSTRWHQALGAETRNRLTGASIPAEIKWRLGRLVGPTGLGRI